MFAAAQDELGGLDGIVDIVGMAQYASLLDVDDENWRWHHDIVLRHAHLAVTLGGRAMAESGGGVMVFVASVSGLTSAPLHGAYGVSPEYPIGRYLRDAKVLQIVEGSNDLHRALIGEMSLGLRKES